MKTPIPVRLDFDGMVWDYCGLEAKAITCALRAAEQRGMEIERKRVNDLKTDWVNRNQEKRKAIKQKSDFKRRTRLAALAQGGEVEVRETKKGKKG